MIKRTLYFGNPSYLSIKNVQLTIRLPEVKQYFDLFKLTLQGFKTLEGLKP